MRRSVKRRRGFKCGWCCCVLSAQQVYTPAAISALFADLKQEVALALLFLKSVCSIEVLELQAGQQQPQLLFSCSVANRTAELQRQRAMFTAAVAAPADQQVAGTYKLELVLRWGPCISRACFPGTAGHSPSATQPVARADVQLHGVAAHDAGSENKEPPSMAPPHQHVKVLSTAPAQCKRYHRPGWSQPGS